MSDGLSLASIAGGGSVGRALACAPRLRCDDQGREGECRQAQAARFGNCARAAKPHVVNERIAGGQPSARVVVEKVERHRRENITTRYSNRHSDHAREPAGVGEDFTRGKQFCCHCPVVGDDDTVSVACSVPARKLPQKGDGVPAVDASGQDELEAHRRTPIWPCEAGAVSLPGCDGVPIRGGQGLKCIVESVDSARPHRTPARAVARGFEVGVEGQGRCVGLAVKGKTQRCDQCGHRKQRLLEHDEAPPRPGWKKKSW